MGTFEDGRPPADRVIAAQQGDSAALDELLAAGLPLVYNIVGRALRRHSDVDDLVQETMLAVVRGLPQLRDPAAFRSWMVAVTVRQVRWHQAHLAAAPPTAALDEAPEPVDPHADFVDLCILRLGLTGQRREVAEATRWLDPADQELLSLWWLEAAGHLNRRELAAALGLNSPHAAVRVQRMKQQLDIARTVVRALGRVPRCGELALLTEAWDGVPSPLWRKRLARHVRDCADCGASTRDLVPAEGLLAGLALVPVPSGDELAAGSLPAGAHPADPASSARRHGRAVRRSRVKSIGTALGAVLAVSVIGVGVALTGGHPSATRALPSDAVAAPGSSSPPPTTAAAPTAPPSSAAPSSPQPSPSSSAPLQGGPVVIGAKKGVSTWNFTGVTQALTGSGASWYYTWAPDHAGITSPAGVEFVPMIWGSAAVGNGSLDRAKHQGGTLLGFNEPDMASQSNLSPQQALDLWPKLMTTGLTLGSPAVATGAATPGGWLDQFMQGARSKGYRVDFLTVHWYGSDFSTANAVGQLQSYLQAVHDRYHLPIWLTEYALIKFSGGTGYPPAAQQAAFVTASTTMLQNLPFVQRYAWFALPATKPGATGLFQPGGTPNTIGAAYAAAGH